MISASVPREYTEHIRYRSQVFACLIHYRDRITLAVLELSEKEELARLEKIWWYENGECGPDAAPKNKVLTFSLSIISVAFSGSHKHIE
jgi:hypothetical protein